MSKITELIIVHKHLIKCPNSLYDVLSLNVLKIKVTIHKLKFGSVEFVVFPVMSFLGDGISCCPNQCNRFAGTGIRMYSVGSTSNS